MSMETVKAAIKLVEAKRKVVNSLEARYHAAIAKVNVDFDAKVAVADAELEKALEDLDAVYKTVRNGGQPDLGTEAETATPDLALETEAV